LKYAIISPANTAAWINATNISKNQKGIANKPPVFNKYRFDVV
jgi:hypothetical protein